MAPPTAEDYLVGNIEHIAGPTSTSKADYFREPKNFFGINVTTVDPVVGPHWHPNADEFDLFLNGEGRVGIIKTFVPPPKEGEPPEETAVEFNVKKGDIIVIPQGYAHYYVNDSGKENPLQFLAVFNNNAFKLINTSQVPDPSLEKP